MKVVAEIDSTTAFAGMVDAVEETEEEKDRRVNTYWWYSLHSRQVRADVVSPREVRRLGWNCWPTKLNYHVCLMNYGGT